MSENVYENSKPERSKYVLPGALGVMALGIYNLYNAIKSPFTNPVTQIYNLASAIKHGVLRYVIDSNGLVHHPQSSWADWIPSESVLERALFILKNNPWVGMALLATSLALLYSYLSS